MYGQGIIAGQVSVNDLYKDVIPDCTMCASPYNPNWPNYHMDLDLDQLVPAGGAADAGWALLAGSVSFFCIAGFLRRGLTSD